MLEIFKLYAMFNLALGLSVLLAAFAPLGQQVLLMFVRPSAIHASIGTLGTVVIALLFKYIVPAIGIYAVMRGLGIQHKMNFRAHGSGLILAGNLVVLFFAVARALTSLVEGGGSSFLLASLAPYVLWPAWIVIVVGFIRLMQAQSGPASAGGEAA